MQATVACPATAQLGYPTGTETREVLPESRRQAGFASQTDAVEQSEIRYVAVGDADVAYRTLGQGPPDLLYCYGLGNHVELASELLGVENFFTRLSSICRTTVFDRRGTGASDGVPASAVPSWEQLTEDMTAVLTAVGSKRSVIMAASDTGPMGILYAAMHPEMVSGLVLVNTAARYLMDDDYPEGVTSEGIDWFLELVASSWSTDRFNRLANPSMANDDAFIRRANIVNRSSATPRSAVAQYRYLLRHVDVRSALPLIQVPTLVLHARKSPFVPISLGRYLADHIDGARFVELTHDDVGLNPAVVYDVTDEVAQFLTGVRLDTVTERVLTTVLFSDIVGSTKRAVSLGDQRWRSLLDLHDKLVRDELHAFRGREVKTTGDGFLACFDGPARAIRCARSIIERTKALGIEVRVGLHTGECEVRGEDLGGLAVHIAARVGAAAQAGEVLASSTVRELVAGSGIEFEHRGEHELKGVPGTWRLFAVRG